MSIFLHARHRRGLHQTPPYRGQPCRRMPYRTRPRSGSGTLASVPRGSTYYNLLRPAGPARRGRGGAGKKSLTGQPSRSAASWRTARTRWQWALQARAMRGSATKSQSGVQPIPGWPCGEPSFGLRQNQASSVASARIRLAPGSSSGISRPPPSGASAQSGGAAPPPDARGSGGGEGPRPLPTVAVAAGLRARGGAQTLDLAVALVGVAREKLLAAGAAGALHGLG